VANGPSEYSLMWANNHINGMSWADLVELIQTEAVDKADAERRADEEAAE
jgi:hypothetical protein